MRIGICKIRMRLRQPGGLDEPHRTADLMRLALELRRQHRGRHQRRRKLHRLLDGLTRAIAVDLFQFKRTRGEQHAALAAVALLVEQPGFQIVVEDFQRAVPIALGTAEAEHRMRRPVRRWRKFQHFLGDHDRGNRIVGALRFDEQPAQTEQPRILALRHRIERGPRAHTVAVELRRLRMQQQRKGILARKAARTFGIRARRRGIAVTDREQALGNGVPPARMTALAPRPPHPFRCLPHHAQEAPHDHRHHDDDAQRHRKDRQRGRDAIAAPGQRDLAGLIGDPRSAGRGERDTDEEKDDANHEAPITPVSGVGRFTTHSCSECQIQKQHWNHTARAPGPDIRKSMLQH